MARYFEVISEYAELPKEERPILPKRQTANSAGYDFYALEDVVLPVSGETTIIRTGIKACMPKDEVLFLFIRSSMAIKQGLQLTNCVAVIDSDYYNNPDNEGEILIAVNNILSWGDVTIKKGERFAQGIFVKYGVTDNDDADGERIGGVGSSGT